MVLYIINVDPMHDCNAQAHISVLNVDWKLLFVHYSVLLHQIWDFYLCVDHLLCLCISLSLQYNTICMESKWQLMNENSEYYRNMYTRADSTVKSAWQSVCAGAKVIWYLMGDRTTNYSKSQQEDIQI